MHVGQLAAQPGLARGGQSRADAEPAGYDLAALRPAEHPGDRAQPGQARSGVGPLRRPGADVQRAEQLGRGGRPEVRGQVGVLDQAPVRPEGRSGHHVHRGVPAGQVLQRLPGRGVQQGRLQYRGHGQLQVLPGQYRQRVLVRDDLTLLGHLDGTVQRAVRLGEDRLVCRPAAAADGTPAAVEEPQPYPVLGRHVAQRALGPVDGPLRAGDPGLLVGVGVPEHDLLQVAAGP